MRPIVKISSVKNSVGHAWAMHGPCVGHRWAMENWADSLRRSVFFRPNCSLTIGHHRDSCSCEPGICGFSSVGEAGGDRTHDPWLRRPCYSSLPKAVKSSHWAAFKASLRRCEDQKPHKMSYFAFLYGIFIKKQHDSRPSPIYQQGQLSIKVFTVYQSRDF